MFYTNQKHKLIVKLLKKFIKIRKESKEAEFNKQDELFIKQLENSPSRVYKTLKEKRLYEINPLIGSFQLARFKDETDVVTIWNESFGYISDDIQHKSKKNYTLLHSEERIKIYKREQFNFKIYKIKV